MTSLTERALKIRNPVVLVFMVDMSYHRDVGPGRPERYALAVSDSSESLYRIVPPIGRFMLDEDSANLIAHRLNTAKRLLRFLALTLLASLLL